MNRRAPLALAAALIAGVVMSFGQTVAPESLAPLFNSAAPVVALAAAVALAARGPKGHVVLGALAGPLAMVGYYGTSSLRGYGVSTSMVLLWSTAGVIAGAAMGFAVWALRSKARWPMRAMGAAVFPAVAFGEGAHGVIRISDTTPVGYWWGLIAVGALVLAWLAATRLRSAKAIGLALAAAALGGGVLFVIYGMG